MALRVQRALQRRLPEACAWPVETLQCAVTPLVELSLGIFSQVSGQQKHCYQQIEEKGVWLATAEPPHKNVLQFIPGE